MIASRCLVAGRLCNSLGKNLLLRNVKSNIAQQSKRHSHDEYIFFYRKRPDIPYPEEKLHCTLAGIVWWWVLWHLFTDYHELLPHQFPDPSEWTDEELGVPPLDE